MIYLLKHRYGQNYTVSMKTAQFDLSDCIAPASSIHVPRCVLRRILGNLLVVHLLTAWTKSCSSMKHSVRHFFIRFVFDRNYLDFRDDTGPYFAFRGTLRKQYYQRLQQLETSLLGKLNLSLPQLRMERPFGEKKTPYERPGSTKNMGPVESYIQEYPDKTIIGDPSNQILLLEDVQDFVSIEIEDQGWVEVVV